MPRNLFFGCYSSIRRDQDLRFWLSPFRPNGRFQLLNLNPSITHKTFIQTVPIKPKAVCRLQVLQLYFLFLFWYVTRSVNSYAFTSTAHIMSSAQAMSIVWDKIMLLSPGESQCQVLPATASWWHCAKLKDWKDISIPSTIVLISHKTYKCYLGTSHPQ